MEQMFIRSSPRGQGKSVNTIVLRSEQCCFYFLLLTCFRHRTVARQRPIPPVTPSTKQSIRQKRKCVHKGVAFEWGVNWSKMKGPVFSEEWKGNFAKRQIETTTAFGSSPKRNKPLSSKGIEALLLLNEIKAKVWKHLMQNVIQKLQRYL